MLPITESFIEVNQFSRNGQQLKSTKAIVLHYTASPGAPAINIRNYFNNLRMQNLQDQSVDRYAGAHYSVDRTTIIHQIPDTEVGYHVGSKTYTAEALSMLSKYPNDCTIGIEMCIEKDGVIHEDTFQNAADLAAKLMISHQMQPHQIWTHKGVVGWKDCPLPWVQNPAEFERFKKTVLSKAFPKENEPLCEVWVKGKATNVPGKVFAGEPYVAVKAMVYLLKTQFKFDDQTKEAFINNVKLKTFRIDQNTGFVQARELGHILGMNLNWAGRATDIEFV